MATVGEAVGKLKRLPDPWVILMVGVPGCGKSMLVERLMGALRTSGATVAPTVVNVDAMLEVAAASLGISYQAAFSRFVKAFTKDCKVQVKNALTWRHNLIVDRTQVGRKARREVLAHVPVGYTRVAVTFEVKDAVLNRRLSARAAATGKVIPAFVPELMISSYQTPTKREGFDLIVNVKNDADVR